MADQMFTMDRRARWSDSEVSAMLNIIYEMNVAKVLEAKRQRNKDIFKSIENGMKTLGYKKNWDQIRAKWKMLKSTYLAKKKKTSDAAIFGDPSCKHFEQMDHLLQTGMNESSEFNASDILEVIMNNEDESDNNSSSPVEPPQPSPCCSTTSNTSNCDSNITTKTNNDVAQPSSSFHNENSNSELNFGTKRKRVTSNNRITQDQMKNHNESEDTNDFTPKGTSRNNRKRKRSTPYEEALMKFQISQAKLYRQLQKEENEWMERQLEKMQRHDERLMQAQTEQMREMIRSVGLIVEPIVQRTRSTTHNNTCKESKKS